MTTERARKMGGRQPLEPPRFLRHWYVATRRPRVHHAVCACAYRNSVKIVNVPSTLTLIVAHQSRRTEQQHEQPASYSMERLGEQPFER